MYATKLVTTRRAIKTRIILAAGLWSRVLPITLQIPIRMFFCSSVVEGIQGSSKPMCPLFLN
eukprot:580603-Pelagomonas_calceolata.AAC.1